MHKLSSLADLLKDACIENYTKETRIIASHILDVDYAELLFNPNYEISDEDYEKIFTLIKRRCLGEPIAKILGTASFWKHNFVTNEFTLDPRPESELIIEAVLKFFPNKNENLSFLDLGTGSGCLLLSCLCEYKNSTGLGIDISSEAIKVANLNSTNLKLENRAKFLINNWASGINESFDVILCNPPYIRDDEKLDRDVLFDPHQALFAGCDGLDAYKEIFPLIKNNVHESTILFFEIGIGQKTDVIKIAELCGFNVKLIINDFQNIPRTIVFSN